jgi:hypothetical protein
VVNLLERDAGLRKDLVDRRRVSDGILGASVERFDQNAHAPIDESRCDESSCIIRRQEARFDADTASDEQLAQLDDPGLSLVGCDELGQRCPAGHQRDATTRVWLYVSRCGQRYWHSRTSAAHTPDRGGARCCGERLTAVVVKRVHVDHASACRDSLAGLFGQL